MKDKEDLRCPISGCPEDFVRSVHLKRHLTGVHKIQNPLNVSEADVTSQNPKIENEKTHLEIKTEAEKVPPLKIKFNHADNSFDSSEVHDDLNVLEKDEAIADGGAAHVGVIINESNDDDNDHDDLQVENSKESTHEDAIIDAKETSLSEKEDEN